MRRSLFELRFGFGAWIDDGRQQFGMAKAPAPETLRRSLYVSSIQPSMIIPQVCKEIREEGCGECS